VIRTVVGAVADVAGPVVGAVARGAGLDPLAAVVVAAIVRDGIVGAVTGEGGGRRGTGREGGDGDHCGDGTNGTGHDTPRVDDDPHYRPGSVPRSMGLWSWDLVAPGSPDYARRTVRLLSRSPVAQFAATGLLAMVLVGLAVVALSRQAGTKEAIRDAKEIARLAGVGVVEPNIDGAVIAGSPGALRRLDEVVRNRVLGHASGIVRVKVWAADGRIVYSDEPRLVGTRYGMDAEELNALHGHGVDAEVSDLTQPENRFERSQKKLLEVYLPIRATNGEPLLFEAYQRFSSVSASGRRLWLAFAPALLGGLLLLQLVNLPLARSLARRLRRGQEEREALLHRALDASQSERRAIAADLHDGIVQDLAGVSFSLAAQAQRLNGHGDAEASAALQEGAVRTRDSVRAMRSLLIDIYPPSLQRSGLPAALEDLATTYSARGLTTTTDLPAQQPQTGPSTEQLLFRCAQEALRNAHRHGHATEARIVLVEQNERLVMAVSDNGTGFAPVPARANPRRGHFGLVMLDDLATGAGGSLSVRSEPGAGTTVCIEVPR
jgi:two-component system NarL family sensor kinase